LETLTDADQFYSSDSESLSDQLSFVAVGGQFFTKVIVDWAPDTTDTSSQGVRADCTPMFDVDGGPYIGDFVTPNTGDHFTCVVHAKGSKYAIAGDDVGAIHLLDLNAGTDTIVAGAVGLGWARRAFEGRSGYFTVWTEKAVQRFFLNKNTGATSSFAVAFYDFETLIDVAKSPDGTHFMCTTDANPNYDIRYIDNIVTYIAAPASIAYAISVGNYVRNESSTQAIAFIDNSHVIVFDNAYPANTGIGGQYGKIYTVDLNIAAPNSNEIASPIPRCSYTCVGFDNNGDYGILSGQITEAPVGYTKQQEHNVIWKINVGSDMDSVTLTPLYRDRADSTSIPINPIQRMRKRHQSNQWFFISRMWTVEDYYHPRVMSVGEKLESPSPAISDTTSTSIELCWSKPKEFASDENMAYVRILRSETCNPDDWECVFASDEFPCCYTDTQHPTIGPKLVSAGKYAEVGLVDQTPIANGGAGEIHPFDPSQDAFPDGRNFYYKVDWISYIGIVGESSIINGTTTKPIPPVHILDELTTEEWETYDWKIPYKYIDAYSEKFNIRWDWTERFGNMDGSKFDRWDVAIYEEINPDITGMLDMEPALDNFNVYKFPWTGASIPAGTAGYDLERGGIVNTLAVHQAMSESLVTYPSGTERKHAIIPYTSHYVTVIGWDTGGLWRVAANENMGDGTWDIKRQKTLIRTEPKPSGVIEIEDYEREKYDGTTPEYRFYDWTNFDESCSFTTKTVGMAPASANYEMCASQFEINNMHEILGYIVHVDSIIGTPSDLRIELYTDSGGLPGMPISGTAATVSPGNIVTGEPFEIRLNSAVNPLIYSEKYHVVISTVFAGAEPAGNAYEITIGISGISDKPGEFFTNPTWTNQTDKIIGVGIICANYASDFISLYSGFVSRFHVNKGTDASYENLLYEDFFICSSTSDNYWDYFSGTGGTDPTVSGGYMSFIASGGQPCQARFVHSDTGTQTRNYIVDISFDFNPSLTTFDIILRDQNDFSVLTTANRHILITYTVATNTWTIYQKNYNATSVTLTSVTNPGGVLSPSTTNRVILKMIDGELSVFTDAPTWGFDAYDQFKLGQAAIKVRLVDSTVPFIAHGFPFQLRTIDGIFRLKEFHIYGKINESNYTGKQGHNIDYGNGFTSGYFRTKYLDNTYRLGGTTQKGEYNSLAHPKNEFDSEDWGMWHDDMSSYEKSCNIDVFVDNSKPICDSKITDTAYIGKAVVLDMSMSYDPDGGNLQYIVDWGDGSIFETSTTPMLSHVYSITGTFTITSYVVDELSIQSDVCTNQITSYTKYGNLPELVPLFPFVNIDIDSANGVSVFNLPDICGSEVHSTKGGSREFSISGYHLESCCCDGVNDLSLVYKDEESSSTGCYPGLSDADAYITSDANDPNTFENSGGRRSVRDTNGKIYTVYEANSNGKIVLEVTSPAGISENTEDIDTVDTFKPTCAIDCDNTLHIVYMKKGVGINSTVYQICYKTRTESGTWSSRNVITDITTDQSNPAIACDKNGVAHITWDGLNTGSATFKSIAYTSSSRSSEWAYVDLDANLTIISNTSMDSTEPSIDTDTLNYPHISWRAYVFDGFYMFKTGYRYSNGSSWSSITLLKTGIGTIDAEYEAYPMIMIDENDDVHIVCTKNSTRVLYWRNVGGSFAYSLPIGGGASSDEAHYVVICREYDTTVFHLYWVGKTYGTHTSYLNVQHIQSTDHGSSWSSIESITDQDKDSDYLSCGFVSNTLSYREDQSTGEESIVVHSRGGSAAGWYWTPDNETSIATSHYFDDTIYENSTTLEIKISVSRSSNFDGDIEIKLLSELSPETDVFNRNRKSIIYNSDISEFDGDDHYITTTLYGCGMNISDIDAYIVITPINASDGILYFKRPISGGDGYYTSPYIGEWIHDDSYSFAMSIYEGNDCESIAYCEHELFEKYKCNGTIFKIFLPQVGMFAAIIVDYRSNMNSEEPTYMKYSMRIVEILEEQLMGG
jgi:hypothetical protein